MLVRELILQLKTGKIDFGYFRRKFGVDVLADWRPVWDQYIDEGWLSIDGDRVTLCATGCLRPRAVAAILRV